MKKYSVILVLLLFSANIFGFGYSSVYIPIEKLSKKNETGCIDLDLKNDTLYYHFEGKVIPLCQTSKKRTGGYFQACGLVGTHENEEYVLFLDKLEKVEDDTILVSGKFYKLDAKRHLRHLYFDKEITVARKELDGVNVSITKKQRTIYGLTIGGIGLSIATASLLLAK